MRIPSSWEDKEVLKDEPLRSAFQTLYQKLGNKYGQRPFQHGRSLDELITLIKREADGVKAVETWLGHASRKATKRRVFAEGQVCVNHFSLFFNFYWILFSRRSSSEAQEVLNDSRSRKALTDLPSLTTSEVKTTNNLSSRVSGKRICSGSKYKKIVKKESDDSALHSLLPSATTRRDTIPTPVLLTNMHEQSYNARKRCTTSSDHRHVIRRTVATTEKRVDKPEVLSSEGVSNKKDKSGIRKGGFYEKHSVDNIKLCARYSTVPSKKPYASLRFNRSAEAQKDAPPSKAIKIELVSFSDVVKTCNQDMVLDTGSNPVIPADLSPLAKSPALIPSQRIDSHLSAQTKGSLEVLNPSEIQRPRSLPPKEASTLDCSSKDNPIAQSLPVAIAGKTADSSVLLEIDMTSTESDTKQRAGLQVDDAYSDYKSRSVTRREEINIKEEHFDTSHPCPTDPAALPLMHGSRERNKEMGYFFKAEGPDFTQAEYQDHSSTAILTDRVEEKIVWNHLSNLNCDGLCRFPKPPLQRFPPIWAQSRQEICESFDWFRSYQGGVYFARDVAKGYLLGAFPSSRDLFEHGGRLIISHGGGRAESLHSFQGHISIQPASDQLSQDKSIRALFNNYFYGRPLVLLIDDKYALFPYDLKAKGVSYAVLGFYTVAHVWAEYQPANNETGRVVRFKFAFRWCEEQGQPWWLEKKTTRHHLGPYNSLFATVEFNIVPGLENFQDMESHTYSDQTPAESSAPDSNPTRPYNPDIAYIISERKSLVESCECCHKHSLRIFALAWVCLNPDCARFWKQSDGQYLPLRLDYHPNFLILPPSKPIPPGFGSLEPASPKSFIPEGNETNYAFSRGFHCHKCGRLSCRYMWESWECMNPRCREAINLRYPVRHASEFSFHSRGTTFKNHWINPISEIVQSPSITFSHESGRGILHTFLLPYDGAKIHHIQSGNGLGRKEADVVFHEYQVQAASGVLKFRRWPMRAHKCRGALLTNYFSQNSGEPYKYVGGDANTVPFDRAPEAVVKARALIQKRIGQALKIPADFNEVLSAAYMERQRMAFHSDNEVGLGPLVAGLSLGSPAMMHFRLHPRHDPHREKKGILLSIVLRHGDILVMDGSGVQDYYEHTVIPENFRIAATARQINAGHN